VLGLVRGLVRVGRGLALGGWDVLPNRQVRERRGYGGVRDNGGRVHPVTRKFEGTGMCYKGQVVRHEADR
jgi:hypothetical protein